MATGVVGGEPRLGEKKDRRGDGLEDAHGGPQLPTTSVAEHSTSSTSSAVLAAAALWRILMEAGSK